MDAIEALRTRRSVRMFEPRPVDKALLETIVDCGRLAATACNEQPWEFVVVTDTETRQRIAGITDHGKFIADAPVCIAVLCLDTKYYIEDGSAATQNLLVAAHACGLGTCWVAGDKKAYCGDITELLGVPPQYRLFSLVAAGYSGKIPVPQKRALAEVLHWERF